MAFYVNESTYRGGGSWTESGAGNSSATREFVVKFSTQPSSYATLQAAIGTAPTAGTTLPILGSALPGETLATGQLPRTLTSYDIRSADGKTGLQFMYVANYSQASLDPNPLSRPDEVTFEGSREVEEYFIDESTSAVPVVNSAGDPFEKNPERTTGAFKLCIEGNRAPGSVSLSSYITYLRPSAVNSASFTVRGNVVGTGEAKMVAISVGPVQTENGVRFCRVRWEMDLAPDWLDHIADRGFHELNTGGDQVDIWRGVPAKRPDKPWPLNGSGGAWGDPTIAPAILDFQPYPKKSFATFSWTTAL